MEKLKSMALPYKTKVRKKKKVVGTKIPNNCLTAFWVQKATAIINKKVVVGL